MWEHLSKELLYFLWLDSYCSLLTVLVFHRSNNVFLRMTDGRKYCYYSYYVWSWTILLTTIAIFAHFFLDVVEELPEHHGLMPRQVAVGNNHSWAPQAILLFDSRWIIQPVFINAFLCPIEKMAMILFSGWLGIALFFFPVACTILLDLYFFLSTSQLMSRITLYDYGHIHHKLRYR